MPRYLKLCNMVFILFKFMFWFWRNKSNHFTFFGQTNSVVHVLAAQQASLLLRAALLSILLCSPQCVLSESDEEVLTEWEIWKSSHGISYNERVRRTPQFSSVIMHTCSPSLPSMCFCRMICRGESSGRTITRRLKTTTKASSWAGGLSLWLWINMETL